jgi:hypothetical protein
LSIRTTCNASADDTDKLSTPEHMSSLRPGQPHT